MNNQQVYLDLLIERLETSDWKQVLEDHRDQLQQVGEGLCPGPPPASFSPRYRPGKAGEPQPVLTGYSLDVYNPVMDRIDKHFVQIEAGEIEAGFVDGRVMLEPVALRGEAIDWQNRDRAAQDSLLRTMRVWRELTAPVDVPSPGRPATTINHRVARQIERKPDIIDIWNARDWADFLGCRISSIARSAAWQAIRQIRCAPPEQRSALARAEIEALLE